MTNKPKNLIYNSNKFIRKEIEDVISSSYTDNPEYIVINKDDNLCNIIDSIDTYNNKILLIKNNDIEYEQLDLLDKIDHIYLLFNNCKIKNNISKNNLISPSKNIFFYNCTFKKPVNIGDEKNLQQKGKHKLCTGNTSSLDAKLSFEKCIFESYFYIYNQKFSDTLNIIDSEINGEFQIKESELLGFNNLTGTKFNSDIQIKRVEFNGYTDFSNSEFKGQYVNIVLTEFNKNKDNNILSLSQIECFDCDFRIEQVIFNINSYFVNSKFDNFYIKNNKKYNQEHNADIIAFSHSNFSNFNIMGNVFNSAMLFHRCTFRDCYIRESNFKCNFNEIDTSKNIQIISDFIEDLFIDLDRTPRYIDKRYNVLDVRLSSYNLYYDIEFGQIMDFTSCEFNGIVYINENKIQSELSFNKSNFYDSVEIISNKFKNESDSKSVKTINLKKVSLNSNLKIEDINIDSLRDDSEYNRIINLDGSEIKDLITIKGPILDQASEDDDSCNDISMEEIILGNNCNFNIDVSYSSKINIRITQKDKTHKEIRKADFGDFNELKIENIRIKNLNIRNISKFLYLKNLDINKLDLNQSNIEDMALKNIKTEYVDASDSKINYIMNENYKLPLNTKISPNTQFFDKSKSKQNIVHKSDHRLEDNNYDNCSYNKIKFIYRRIYQIAKRNACEKIAVQAYISDRKFRESYLKYKISKQLEDKEATRNGFGYILKNQNRKNYLKKQKKYSDLEDKSIIELLKNISISRILNKNVELLNNLVKYLFYVILRLCSLHSQSLKRVILTILATIFFFAIIYSYTGIKYNNKFIGFSLSKSILYNLEVFTKSLNFSILSFTTIGSSNYESVNIFTDFIVGVEALIGVFLTAFFIFILGKKSTQIV